MGIAALFYVDLALAIVVTLLITKLGEWLGSLRRGDGEGGGGEWRWRRSRPRPPRGDLDRGHAPRLPGGPREHRARLPR